MAGVVICDRCSRFGRGEALGAIAFKPVMSDEGKSEHKELCPDCVESFVEWLATPPKDAAAAGPFTEPYKRPEPDADSAEPVKALTASPRGRAARR